MRLLSARLKFITVAALCVGVVAGWVLHVRMPSRRITDRELLQEAFVEWQRAVNSSRQPAYQIFEQQAAQGYYDDAAATGYLLGRTDEVKWSIVELARIRTENGDLQGAKAAMKRFAGSDLGKQIAQAVALAQVSRGDLEGALDIATAGVDRDDIFLEFARRQIEHADFAGALQTAARMRSPDQVFYILGDALRARSEQNRVRELASGIRDRKVAARFAKLVRITLWPPTGDHVIQAGPCEEAGAYAEQGKFAEADALIEQNKCTFVSYVVIRQYAVDPVGAEHLLRSRSNPEDLLCGLDDLAVAAAREGNVTEALRFLGDLQNLKDAPTRIPSLGQDKGNEAVQGIARYWTIRDGPKKVLKWARSRPTIEQRTWALIGMAEALGHARPAG
jgi:tetratricopeptide (TPR) repeat protein